MSKNIKNLIILVMAIITVLCVAWVIKMYSDLQKTKSKMNQQMSFRLDMEQKVDELSKEKMDLLTTIKNKDLKIQELSKELESTKQHLSEQEEKLEEIKKELEGLTAQRQQAVEGVANTAK